MKNKFIIVLLFIVLLLIILAAFIVSNYYINYLNELGVCYTYDETVENIGKPINSSIEQDDGATQYTVAVFEHCTVTFWNDEQGYPGMSVKTEVLDETVRFGIFGFGIGTKRNILEFAYVFAPKIKDVLPNEYGIILNDQWTYFEFDEGNKVSKVVITDGV